MVQKLKDIDIKPLQYKFDKDRPDLSKLDSLFGQLSMETSTFLEEVMQVRQSILEGGINLVFDNIS